jgi:D-beta-D-heptose 7-phosphate kinase/D-beta-D-heptose 1-phosphate adenosyltransferase
MMLPPLAPERARVLAAHFPHAHVLVVGDAMLDTFVAGRVTRISPEAPVPVVRFTHETRRVGGAANVAHNVAALGGRATLVAVTGQDETAATLAAACREAGVAPVFVSDPTRSTTTKMRIVTERNQQVARVDYEVDTDIDGVVEQRVVALIREYARDASAIVISDYVKGCVTRAVAQAAIAEAHARRIPALVDPKIPHLGYYEGASVVTPNHLEAETATHQRVRTADEAQRAARLFAERTDCQAVLVTRGDQGMWLFAADSEGALPATAREVADVTGAGDTVIATLALGLASGAALAEAAWLANEAAGLAVAKFGAAVVSPAELLDALDRLTS